MPDTGAPVAADADVVRVYAAGDHKDVSMLVGQSIMEGLARANNRTLFHPVTVVCWVLASLAIDYVADYRPKAGQPFSSLLPLIGFAVAALPVLGLAEYAHRPVFTRRMRHALGAPDVVSPAHFYTLDPRSTLLVFARRGEVNAVLALDARRAGEDLGTVLGDEEGMVDAGSVALDKVGIKPLAPAAPSPPPPRRAGLRQRKVADDAGAAATAPPRLPGTAEIRHFTVEIPIRRAGVGAELLAHALDHAFAVAPFGGAAVPTPADRVIVFTDPFTPGGERIWRKFAFVPVPAGECAAWAARDPVGLLRWRGRWLQLSRADWVARRDKVFA